MQRFAFGRNWLHFFDQQLGTDNADTANQRIMAATEALSRKLPGLGGKSFLDVGSGSGIHSLAAQRLGATVYAFDYDLDSVECTRAMRNTYGSEAGWFIEQGSALDDEYLKRLGTFDVVYSWGVLHHTGDMYRALENMVPLVAPGGRLFVSIYNDQGWRSAYWTMVKRAYNLSALLRGLIWLAHLPIPLAVIAVRTLQNRPLERGMSIWIDYSDWLGGYPFEVASFEEISSFYQSRGFTLGASKRASSGCNEFVFHRQ